jgi:MFS transporter, FSR family, fosmidomycin resistance protein
MLVGGFLAARTERLERLIAASLTAAAVVLALVGAGVFTGMHAAVVIAVAGLGAGLAGPSRDMLIKRAAPPGATGRVYGAVYSGLDLGFALAAPIFGALLDHGRADGVFYGTALALMLGVASAAVVGEGIARRARPGAEY